MHHKMVARKTMNKHIKGSGLRKTCIQYNRVHNLVQPITENIRVQLGISDDDHTWLEIGGGASPWYPPPMTEIWHDVKVTMSPVWLLTASDHTGPSWTEPPYRGIALSPALDLVHRTHNSIILNTKTPKLWAERLTSWLQSHHVHQSLVLLRCLLILFKANAATRELITRNRPTGHCSVVFLYVNLCRVY